MQKWRSKPWLPVLLSHNVRKCKTQHPKGTKFRNMMLNFLTVNGKHVEGLRSMTRWVSPPSTLDEVQSRQTGPPLVANKLPWLLPHKGRMPGRSRESQAIKFAISILERWIETDLKGETPLWRPLQGAHPVSAACAYVTSRSQIPNRDSFPCPAQRQGRPGSVPVSLFVSWIK